MRIIRPLFFILIYFPLVAQPESVDTDRLWSSEKEFEFQFTDCSYSDTLKIDKYLEAIRFRDSGLFERFMYYRNDEPFVYEWKDTTIVWTFFEIADKIYFHDFDGDGKEDIFINYYHWGMGVMDNSIYFNNGESYTCMEIPVGKIIMAENWPSSSSKLAVIIPKLHVEIIEIDFKERQAKTIKEITTCKEYEEYLKE